MALKSCANSPRPGTVGRRGRARSSVALAQRLPGPGPGQRHWSVVIRHAAFARRGGRWPAPRPSGGPPRSQTCPAGDVPRGGRGSNWPITTPSALPRPGPASLSESYAAAGPSSPADRFRAVGEFAHDFSASVPAPLAAPIDDRRRSVARKDVEFARPSVLSFSRRPDSCRGRSKQQVVVQPLPKLPL